jgi:hypothetical protein
MDRTMDSSMSGTSVLNNDVLLFRSLLSWRSILAGTLLSLLFYVVLLALGVGLLGVSVDNNLAAPSLGIASGIWVIVANAVALFGGAYIATRSTAFSSRAVGMWQATVMSALFFAFVLFQMTSWMGTAGRFVGGKAGGAADVTRGASDLLSSPQVQDLMDATFDGLQLKSPPEVVARGVATRLAQGDTDSAENYLARQAGISPEQVHSKIQIVQTQLQAFMNQTREAASATLATAGFALFVVMIIGLISAMVGGYVGARENLRHPVTEEDNVKYTVRPIAANL